MKITKIMKKITIALLFLTIGMQAQTFPQPYCNIAAAGTTTEEITSVVFGETVITNTDFSSILINQTATIANVTPGESYILTLKGNTKGNFDNDIVAYIDWNRNDTLNDAGEIYEVGMLTNSTGADNTSVSFAIAVPENAMIGQTRIRITKIFSDDTSPSIMNPCAIEMDAFGQGNFPGFGQAIDFTLEVATLSTSAFDKNAFLVFPVPTKDALNIAYKSVVNDVKIYNLIGQEVYSQSINSADAQLNIESLATGTYIVKVTAENAQHTFKIVKE